MIKDLKVIFVSVIILAVIPGFVYLQEVSVESMPPSVIKTMPVCGDTKVDPNIAEIRVVFSKDMMTNQMWSWCMYSADTFPEVDTNGIKYLQDKRTCILPVKLEPDKTYVIWINLQDQNSFRDTNGNPAVPYLLVFETRD